MFTPMPFLASPFSYAGVVLTSGDAIRGIDLGLSGATAGGYGTLSGWFRAPGLNWNNVDTLCGKATADSGDQVWQMRFSVGIVSQLDCSDLSDQFDFDSDSGNPTAASAANWAHFLYSWDMGGNTAQMYINDVECFASVTATGKTSFPWADTTGNSFVAAVGPSTNSSEVAEYWLTAGSSSSHKIDLSVAANRRLFTTSAGKPANLGANGSTPLGGTAPLIYCHVDGAEAVNNIALNRSGRGNLSVTGTLAYSGTLPSY